MSTVRIQKVFGPRRRRVAFLAEPGAKFYVRRVLSGEEYPVVFPGVFQPQTIVDIGAHVGSAALYFRQAYPQARICSFEPNPACYELLERNVARESGIETHQMAIGPDDARCQLFSGVFSSLQASLVPNEENRSTGPVVNVRAVNSVLNELGIDRISVLKVDTEGMELPILRALGDRLAEMEVIYLEYHSERDRRDLDTMLADRFVLFASHATVPDRGAVCYVAAESLARWQAESAAPRYVYPKQSILSLASVVAAS